MASGVALKKRHITYANFTSMFLKFLVISLVFLLVLVFRFSDLDGLKCMASGDGDWIENLCSNSGIHMDIFGQRFKFDDYQIIPLILYIVIMLTQCAYEISKMNQDHSKVTLKLSNREQMMLLEIDANTINPKSITDLLHFFHKDSIMTTNQSLGRFFVLFALIIASICLFHIQEIRLILEGKVSYKIIFSFHVSRTYDGTCEVQYFRIPKPQEYKFTCVPIWMFVFSVAKKVHLAFAMAIIVIALIEQFVTMCGSYMSLWQSQNTLGTNFAN